MNRKASRVELGRFGENLARQWLESKGWRIIEANWRCRLGEIDLIAEDGNCLVFVEVRTRTSNRFGTPAESVDWRKQKKVRQLANVFLTTYPVCTSCIRFDMISVQLQENGQAPVLEHFRNGF